MLVQILAHDTLAPEICAQLFCRKSRVRKVLGHWRHLSEKNTINSNSKVSKYCRCCWVPLLESSNSLMDDGDQFRPMQFQEDFTSLQGFPTHTIQKQVILAAKGWEKRFLSNTSLKNPESKLSFTQTHPLDMHGEYDILQSNRSKKTSSIENRIKSWGVACQRWPQNWCDTRNLKEHRQASILPSLWNAWSKPKTLRVKPLHPQGCRKDPTDSVSESRFPQIDLIPSTLPQTLQVWFL